MKKIKIKRKTIYHLISIALIGMIALIGALRFPEVFYRTWEALRDFGKSVAFYFANLFFLDPVAPTVTEFPKELIETFPREWESFTIGIQDFGRLFISSDNLYAYLRMTSNFVYGFCKVLLFVLPIGFVFVLIVKALLKRKNKKLGKISRPLNGYLTIRRRVLLPMKAHIARYVAFVKKNKRYYKIAIALIAFFLNAGTILLEAIAFYLYFIWTFDVLNLYVQLVKLLSDVAPIFLKIPMWILLIVAAVILDKLRKKRAYRHLNALEEKNRTFIKTLPIVTMINGTMGTGKTTVLTDIARSLEVIFREEARERIFEKDMEFPQFPWIALERFLKTCIKKHTVYNLASVSKLMSAFRKAYEADKPIQRGFLRKLKRNYGYRYDDFFFGYDPSHGIEHDDALSIKNVFDNMETYALLYFLYAAPTSMIMSNYAIRSEKFLDDSGNFPQYCDEFFDRPAARIEDSNLSHVMHFDALRLGVKKKDDNPYKDAFEYGVVVITEIGKERGNKNDMEGVHKDANESNQKNDMFNAFLMLLRHSATVDNYPFSRFITDEQRAEKWGAEARDLCTLLNIDDVSKKRIILPFFFFEEALYLFLRKHFQSFYEDYRYNRADNTLFLYAFKSIYGLIHHHYKRIENRFSVKTVTLRRQAGTQDGKTERIKYYLCTKKAYANTFSTDCYSSFFKTKAARSGVGLMDMPTFRDVVPSFDELSDMESHFMDDVIEVFHQGREGFNPSAPANDKKKRKK